jgi:hypothetical protein
MPELRRYSPNPVEYSLADVRYQGLPSISMPLGTIGSQLSALIL